MIELLERGALQQVGIADESRSIPTSREPVQICPVAPSPEPPTDSGPAVRPGVDAECLRALRERVRATHRPPSWHGAAPTRGDDPQVNEEWNCDKGRWAFTLRPRTGPVGDPTRARSRRRATAGVLAGSDHGRSARARRATAGPGCSSVDAPRTRTPTPTRKFARVVLRHRRRRLPRAAAFRRGIRLLASHVAGRGLGPEVVTYDDSRMRHAVVLVAFEPRRSRRSSSCGAEGVRTGRAVILSIAPFASRGLDKMSGPAARRAGDEPAISTNSPGPISCVVPAR